MVTVDPRRLARAVELNFELKLIPRYGFAADHARKAAALPAERAVRLLHWKPAASNCHLSLLSQVRLVGHTSRTIQILLFVRGRTLR